MLNFIVRSEKGASPDVFGARQNSLFASASVLAITTALASVPIDRASAQSACSTFAPASGVTVTCTFGPAMGDADPINGSIVAPGSTNVTVNISDPVDRGFDSEGVLFGAAPTINLGGAATINISNSTVSNVFTDEDTSSILEALAPGSGITTVQGLADFLVSQGIPATVDGSGDLVIADADLPAANNAIATLFGPSSGVVIELNGAGNTINLDQPDPSLFDGSIAGALATGIDANASSTSTIDLGSGSVTSFGSGGAVISQDAGSTLTVTGDGADLTGFGVGTSVVELLGAGTTGTFTLDDTIITTSGNNSPAFLASGPNNTLEVNISEDPAVMGDGPLISTNGDNSALFQSTGDNSTLSVTLTDVGAATGSDEAVTFGDNSSIFDVSGAGSQGTFNADNSDLLTVGNNSNLVRSQGGAGLSVFLSDGASGTTQGEMSAGVFTDEGDNANFFLIGTDNSMITTTGPQSAGVDFSSLDNSTAFVTFATGSAITTSGDDSPGARLADGDNTVAGLSFNNAVVTTSGDNSAGFVLDFSDNTGVDLGLTAANGAGAVTQGDNSPGFVLLAGSPIEAIVNLDDASFTTSGENAPALVFDPLQSGAPVAGSIIGFNITDSTISTTGDISDALALLSGPGGANTSLPTGVTTPNTISGSTISTTGAFSDAFVIGEDVIVRTDDAPAPAMGATDLVVDFSQFSATGTGSRSAVNNGTILGGANGLDLSGTTGNIADNGLIQGTGATAVTFGATDDIFEIQPGSTTTGIVDADGGTDTLILGGEGTATFDRARLGTQFLSFETFQKEDLSIFTLTGPDQEVSFDVFGGELIVGADTSLSGATPFTVTTGQTRVTNTDTGLEEIIDTFGTLRVADGVTVSTDTTNTNAVDVFGGLDAPLVVDGIDPDTPLTPEQSSIALFVDIDGTVSTTGDGSGGVVGTDPNGNAFFVDIIGDGEIITTGDNAPGINSTGTSELSIALAEGSSVSTTGEGSDGISVSGSDSSLTITGGDAPSISTTGNNSAGIAARGDNSTLIVDAFTGLISTEGDNAPGVLGASGASITATSFTGSSSGVMTTGTNSPGIFAELNGDATFAGAFFGPLTASDPNGAQISTIGDFSPGLELISTSTAGAPFDNNFSTFFVDGSGIATQGADSPGILYEFDGVFEDIVIGTFVSEGSSVTTTGINSPGFSVDFTGEQLTLGVSNNFSGLVETNGANSPGIIFKGASVATLQEINTGIFGRTVTNGADSAGITFDFTDDEGTVLIFSSRDSETITRGDNSPALSVLADSVESVLLSFDDTQYLTEGDNSTAVIFDPVSGGAAADGSTLNLNATDALFRTTGNGSNGFAIGENFDDPNVTSTIDLAGLTIETTGLNSNGLVIGSNSTIPFGGSITTTGDTSNGVLLNSDSGIVLSGSVSTSGFDANGIEGMGSGFAITTTAAGSIETSGFNSDGIYVNYDGAPAFMAGQIDHAGSINTTGTNADGIALFFNAASAIPGGGVINTTNVSGSISTTGLSAHGINAYFADGTENLINVLPGGSISATGDGASGIYLTSVPMGTGTATSTINVLEGATVSAAQDIAIGEGTVVPGNTVINTTLRVAGSVLRPNAADVAIDLEDGDDTLIIEPTFNIVGQIDLGDGFDTLVFNADAGETGEVAFLDTSPFATGVERTEKTGDGTFVFLGEDVPETAPFAPAFILAGTAQIDVNAPSIDVTNEAGGTVTGTGTVGNFTNNGTFSPGNQIGTFNVAGDLVLNSGGIFNIEIEAPDNSDLVQVGGTTMLGGTLNVLGTDLLSAFTASNQFTIIDSAGDVSSEFDTVNDNLPDLDVDAVVVDGGDGGEEVQLNLVAISAPAGASDPGDVSDKSIHPNSVQSGAGLALEFGDIVHDRARSAGSSPNGGISSGFALAMLTSPTVSFGADIDAVDIQSGGFEGSYIWAAGYGGARDVDGFGALAGYDASFGGVAAGVDGVFSHDATLYSLGVAFGGSNGNVDSGLGSADIDSLQVSGYGRAERGSWLFAGTAAFHDQDYEISRAIPIGPSFVTAFGDTDGEVFTASAELSYDVAPMIGLASNVISFAPVVRYDHVSAERDGFTETGAGILNLTVSEDDFTRNFISFGFYSDAEFVTTAGVVKPNLEVRYERAFDDDNVTSSSIIASVSGAGFTTTGAFEDEDRVVVGAGFEIELGGNFSANFDYDGTFASDFQDHRGSGGVRLKF